METRDIHVLGRQAVALHQQGKTEQAEQLYRQVLEIDPRVFPALYLLGVVRLEQGDSAEALEVIGRALALNSVVWPPELPEKGMLLNEELMSEASALLRKTVSAAMKPPGEMVMPLK